MAAVSQPDPAAAPAIDYLAKDYASFRQQMLDDLALRLPDLVDDNAAAQSMAIVELLAFAGDDLSYYQDAVGTEAYLGTARLRVSVARHAQLLDYWISEGVNSRVWVKVLIAADTPAGAVLPAGTALLTDAPGLAACVADLADLDAAVSQGARVFETMEDLEGGLELQDLALHDWGRPDFSLAAGSTTAAVVGLSPRLTAGRALLLGPLHRPRQRHVVRLTSVEPGRDPATGQAITSLGWAAEDALPFELPVAVRGAEAQPRRLGTACANVVLADFGATWPLAVPGTTVRPRVHLPPVPCRGNYRPQLPQAGMIFRVPYLPAPAADGSAAGALRQDPARAMPALRLRPRGLAALRRWLAGTAAHARLALLGAVPDRHRPAQPGKRRPQARRHRPRMGRRGRESVRRGGRRAARAHPPGGAVRAPRLPAPGALRHALRLRRRAHRPSRGAARRRRAALDRQLADRLRLGAAAGPPAARRPPARRSPCRAGGAADGGERGRAARPELPRRERHLPRHGRCPGLARRGRTGAGAGLRHRESAWRRPRLLRAGELLLRPAALPQPDGGGGGGGPGRDGGRAAPLRHLGPAARKPARQGGHRPGTGPGHPPAERSGPARRRHAPVRHGRRVVMAAANGPPERFRIRFRAGTWSSFRAAMLAALPMAQPPGAATPPLAGLALGGPNDWVTALVDAWAVVGDILTFYQERIVNEGFLATASQPFSVAQLFHTIGFPLPTPTAAETHVQFTVSKITGAGTPAGSGTGTVPAGSPLRSLLGQAKTTAALDQLVSRLAAAGSAPAPGPALEHLEQLIAVAGGPAAPPTPRAPG